MDPLSISASVIALIQATNKVISLCYNYTASAKGAARAFTRVLDEIKSLRNALESLVQILGSDEHKELATGSLEGIEALCDLKDGPIAKQMKYLERKLHPPEWAGRDGSRRQEVIQKLMWPLREGDAKKTLENIEKWKSTLNLALTVNQKAMLVDNRHTQNKNFASLDQSLKSLNNDERGSKILQWRSPPDPSINLNAGRKRRHVDTGLWILENKRFQKWKAAGGSFLWLHGIPGCGKTVLSSTIVEDLSSTEPNNITAYFYFDFNDGAKQYTDKMLRSLVIQLASSYQSIPEPLYALFKSCHDGSKAPQTEEVESLLEALIEQSQMTFAVLDALDECKDRLVLIEFIEKVMRWKSRKFNIVMTSRKLKNLEDFFDTELEESSKLSTQNAKVDEDIRSYVHKKLRNDRRFNRWQKQPNVLDEIETKLMRRSGGMFRWASCQLDVLSGCLNLSKLRQALDSLPKTLDETYERILCSIDPSFKVEALRILQWLTYSRRPLSLEEVAEVIAFDIDENDFIFKPENRLPEPNEVLSICCGLVISVDMDVEDSDSEEGTHDSITAETAAVKTETPTVRLAHFSVKEYLTSHRILEGKAAAFSIDEEASNVIIGGTSLSCLLLFDSASFSDVREFSNEFPLAQYSAEHWNEHLLEINAGAHSHLYALATVLLQSKDKFGNWIALNDIDVDVGSSACWSDGPQPDSIGSPLYYAVLTRLKALVETVIDFEEGKAAQVKACDVDRSLRSAINHPTDTSHFSSERVFINATGGLLGNPLVAAIYLGDKSIVTLLIGHGADPDAFWGPEETTDFSLRPLRSALWAASSQNRLDIVELLLDAGADLHEGVPPEALEDCKENNDRSGDITKRCETDVAIDENLEERSAPYESRAYLAQNEQHAFPPFDTADKYAYVRKKEFALQAAAKYGYTHVVKSLLDRGANINQRSWPMGGTALHMASVHGHNEVVHLLLKKGALVDKTNIYGDTALTHVCDYIREPTIRILLEMRADCNCIGTTRGKPMITAINNRSEKIVRLLLDHGADVAIKSRNAGSFLRAAVVTGHEPTVRLLLEYGADVNEDWPLIEALRRGYKDIAKLLIGSKANVNAVQGFTVEDGLPCWLYALPTTRHFVETLLSFRGIYKLCIRPRENVLSKQPQYVWEDSPLWVAAARGDEDSVQLLLGNGANPNHYGTYGITPLQIATIEEHEVIVQLMTAASDDSFPKVECLDEEERLVGPIYGDPLDDPQRYDNSQPMHMAERRCKAQVESLIAIQPAESSKQSEFTAQHQPRSSHSISVLPPASLSMPSSTVLEARGKEGHPINLDMLKFLIESKSICEAKGYEMETSSTYAYAMKDIYKIGLQFESLPDLSKGHWSKVFEMAYG